MNLTNTKQNVKNKTARINITTTNLNNYMLFRRIVFGIVYQTLVQS